MARAKVNSRMSERREIIEQLEDMQTVTLRTGHGLSRAEEANEVRQLKDSWTLGTWGGLQQEDL